MQSMVEGAFNDVQGDHTQCGGRGAVAERT